MPEYIEAPEERCCVCGHTLGGTGPQKGLCDACMMKWQEEGIPKPGTSCPLCGERRRRNLVKHGPSGEYVCHSCRDALGTLPLYRQYDVRQLRGAFSRRLGPS